MQFGSRATYPHNRRVRVPFVEEMPGTNNLNNLNNGSNGNQQPPRQQRPMSSPEEQQAAEESFSVYFKPVELYNILRSRAEANPLFLQRCLRYKIQAKNKKRIEMAISLFSAMNAGVQARGLFPLYIVLGRRVSDDAAAEDTAIYRFNRACTLTNFSGIVATTSSEASFILPEITKLAMEAKSGCYYLLIFSHGGGGSCLLGKISVESLFHSLEKSSNLNMRRGVEVPMLVDLHSCSVKINCLNEDKFVSVKASQKLENETRTEQVQVSISLEELGAKEKSLYNSYNCDEIQSAAVSRVVELRAESVVFNYRYYNNRLKKTEVAQNFSCPFCLVKCGSFKGLQQHLCSSHDLFNFEFWVTEVYQTVNVSVKTDTWRYEIIANGVDPRQQIFYFCLKRLRRKKVKDPTRNSKHVYPLVFDMPPGFTTLNDRTEGDLNSVMLPNRDPDFVHSVSGNNPPSVMQPTTRTKRLPEEPSDPKDCALLRQRQFFHSQRAQPMALEEVLDDYDSEDEIDNDVADFEDRRMLDDFTDVTKDEKHVMHLWNSFVRKQRVLADAHIPWACEAFSRLHGSDFARDLSLLWCWRLFMIKLWNHGLLDGRSMNNCGKILRQSRNQTPDSNES